VNEAKLDLMAGKVNELAARWIADQRHVKASVEFGFGILWWKNKDDGWTFVVELPTQESVDLVKAPLNVRLGAIQALPELLDKTDELLVARDKAIDDALDLLDGLLEEAVP
jgi:hypothetical protein